MPSCFTAPVAPLAHLDGAPWELPNSAAYLGVSKKTIERAIVDTRLRCIRIGRRVLVPDVEGRRVAAEGLGPKLKK